MLAEGLNLEEMQNTDSVLKIQGYSKLLSITAAQAVEWKIADKEAATIHEVINDLNIGNPQIVNSGNLKKSIQKFDAAKRNMDELITYIEIREDYIKKLNEARLEIEELALTGLTTREINLRPNYRNRQSRYRDRLPSNRYTDYSDVLRNTTYVERYDSDGRLIYPDRRSRTPHQNTERIFTEVPTGDVEQIRFEILATLQELDIYYTRLLALAKRWPGALPQGLSVAKIEEYHVSAQRLYHEVQQSQLNNINRLQNQNAVPR